VSSRRDSDAPGRSLASPRPIYGDRVWPSEKGYDLAASVYDSWHWQEFWIRNELPLVLPIIREENGVRGTLDVGCGTGTYLTALNDGDLTGIDPSKEMLVQARRKVPHEVPLLRGRSSDLPFCDAQFRVCLSTRSLCHESNLSKAAQEIARVAAPGAAWVISEVHPEHKYPRTRIPLKGDDIHIETFKRSHEEIARVAVSSGAWKVERAREYRWSDLSWAPTDALFDRIDRASLRPVFFLMVFRRVATAR
jgi:ubiquinone/menaquinone biosynthesis C-methylase UbiE